MEVEINELNYNNYFFTKLQCKDNNNKENFIDV